MRLIPTFHLREEAGLCASGSLSPKGEGWSMRLRVPLTLREEAGLCAEVPLTPKGRGWSMRRGLSPKGEWPVYAQRPLS